MRSIVWIGVMLILLGVLGCVTEQRIEVEDSPAKLIAVSTMIPASPTTAILEPSPTSQPFLTPPEERRWMASPVLLNMYSSPGYFASLEYHWSLPSDLVIYRDGLVLVSGDGWLRQGQLSSTELCNLLIKIEQNGFFEFASGQYEASTLTDAGTTKIWVQTWRKQFVSAYALQSLMDPGFGIEQEPTVPEGLAVTYASLAKYLPPDLQPYSPDRLQVLVYPLEPSMAVDLRDWHLSDISLAEWMDLYGEVDERGNQVAHLEVSETQIQPLWDLLGKERGADFREGDTIYTVVIRPIYPYEVRSVTEFGAGGINQFATEPRQEMDCSLSDVPSSP